MWRALTGEILKLAFLLGEKMKIEWPIWWCLEPEAQAALMQYQWDKYGYRIEIPPQPSHGHIDTEMESPEEIAKLMRRAPRHQKRVV